MKERYNMDSIENKKQVSAALVKAQKAFGPALKQSSNPHFRSKYADLATCVDAVLDGLNNNGIMLTQFTHDTTDGITVETVFVHESGETFSAGKFFVPTAKHDPQGYGSALTYARRYSLMAACGIAPEDDDGNAAVAAKKYIAREDIESLVGLIEKAGMSLQEFCERAKVSSLDKIEATRLNGIVKSLQAKIGKKEAQDEQ